MRCLFREAKGRCFPGGFATTACLFLAWPGSPARSAEPPPYRASQPAPRAVESLPGTLPDGAYQTPPAVGVPYSRLFRNTSAPYTDPLNPIALTPSARTESVEARTTVRLPAFHLGVPLLQRGFEPQDADLKLGPVFFKLGALSAAALWSDNVNLAEKDRESGTIAIVTISGAVLAQLTEGLRLALSGSFVYLPLQNEAGVTGFGLYGPYVFGLSEDPSLRSEITWNTNIGGWNVIFSDDFTINIGRYSNDYRGTAVLFAGGGFNGVDRAGGYSFGGGGQTISDTDGRNERRTETDILYYSNIISAQTERLTVGKTRLRVRAAHENLWYNQGNRGLPALRDQINVSLVSERENLRFKPFLLYSALRTDLQDRFDHTVHAGVDGPITDQLHLRADIGYYFGPNHESLLWGIVLRHQAGPYTEESVYFRRQLSGFHDEIRESLGYNISQILGPKMVAYAFISHDEVRDLSGVGFSRTEIQTGLSLWINASPRTQFKLTGVGTLTETGSGDYTNLTGLAEASHYFTDTFLARLLYQYQQRASDFRGDSYYENLIYFSLTKYFN